MTVAVLGLPTRYRYDCLTVRPTVRPSVRPSDPPSDRRTVRPSDRL